MNWSREELAASVNAYIEMRELEQRGEKFVKKQYYEDLCKQFGRTPGAFERRMSNISYVYSLLGLRWVRGLKPLKNVGTNVLPVIEELILKHENLSLNLSLEFENQVSNLRSLKILKEPKGVAAPEKKSTKSISFNRDPKVVAWVLKSSGGVCECCNSPAPFKKHDGDFYLEVHHLRRLADGGSDKVTNAIAVCPNCHRELHYGCNRDTLVKKSYENISRLIKE